MKLWLQFDRFPWKKCTAALFVLLMAGFGFVQAVHVHDALVGQTSPALALLAVRGGASAAALITPVSAAPAPVVEAVQGRGSSEPQLQSRLQVSALVHSSSPAKPLRLAEFPLTVGSTFAPWRGRSVIGKPPSGDASVFAQRWKAATALWRHECSEVSRIASRRTTNFSGRIGRRSQATSGSAALVGCAACRTWQSRSSVWCFASAAETRRPREIHR